MKSSYTLQCGCTLETLYGMKDSKYKEFHYIISLHSISKAGKSIEIETNLMSAKA